MAKARVSHSDLMFVSLVAVVILASVFILSNGKPVSTVSQAKVEGTSTTNAAVSAQDMMNELNAVVGDRDSADFVQLKNEASGL